MCRSGGVDNLCQPVPEIIRVGHRTAILILLSREAIQEVVGIIDAMAVAVCL